jgi:acyl-CoA dehydrogenase
MHPSLLACLHLPTDAPATPDLAAWWRGWQGLQPARSTPVALALAGGFAADRVGWAFATGYQAALRRLLPGLPADTVAAFCVTEEAGNRPRDIHTTFKPQPDGLLRVDGAKRWTTLGPASTLLLVVGALPTGDDSARPTLRVARVATSAPGVSLQPMPPTRFVPEVPHARVLLQGVAVDAADLLPGDGYDGYVKPFRTIEDVYVTVAVLAYLLRESRARAWPPAFRETVVAALQLLVSLADGDLQAPAVHLALAGGLHLAARVYGEAGPLWAAAGDDSAAQRWQRDAALFQVAGQARQLRAERAWQRLGAA